MAFDVERLLQLWTDLPADDAAAAAAFGELYTDPVRVNGASVPVTTLVARARALHGALDRIERQVLEVVDAGAQVAVAFRLSGVHVGPLSTSAGPVPPTGQVVALRVIDVLTLLDGRVAGIVMVADELGALLGIGVVRPFADHRGS